MKFFFYLFVTLMLCHSALAQRPFITTWNLDTTGSGATQLTFGVATSGTVNYTWTTVPAGTSGSGTITGTTALITGLPAGVIELSIAPANFQRIIMANGADKNRLTSIKQWGDVAWTSMASAFYGCNNMVLNASDVPNTAAVTDMSSMFRNCKAFNQALPNSFNTAAVTNMSSMFDSCIVYNQALPSSFNTAAVTNMNGMFSNCLAYNKALPSSFNTMSVKDMSFMFYGCDVYNQALPISFNTAAVVNMIAMFRDCKAYNQALPSSFNTAAVTSMNSMFFGCRAYNQALPSSFNTVSVTDMSSMFAGCSAYNQALPSSFNTARVTFMNSMFSACSAYNQALPSSFNTAAVTNMNSMFAGCSAYNQALPSSFSTATVTNMNSMFFVCLAYNQALPSSFNTAAVVDMSNMFKGAIAFNQSLAAWGTRLNTNVNLGGFLDNCGMNQANYDATLSGFNAGTTTGRTMGAMNLKYCAATTDRNNLVKPIANGGKGWTITGDIGCVNATTDMGNTIKLNQNRPNPFSQETVIAFDLSETNKAVLTIFDINGRQVFMSNQGFKTGYNEVILDKSVFQTTGTYFYRLTTENYSSVKRLQFMSE
jgi:hypothetical protein